MKHKPPSITVYADLPQFSLNGGTIPPHILVTNSRPDLVIIDETNKHIALLELTCSFETNADSANVRKSIRYNDLKDDIKLANYKVNLLPFEVGVRGHCNGRNKKAISEILRIFNIGSHQTVNKLIKDMAKISLLCSYSIFQAHSQPTWQDPPFLCP